MNNLQVIIPWMYTESRLAGFVWVMEYWESRFGAVHVEEQTEKVFNKSKLINKAAKQFPNKTLIITDADCFLDDESLQRNIELSNKHAFIIPHDKYFRLDGKETKEVLATNPTFPSECSGVLQEREAAHGVWIIHQQTLEIQPMCERFIGHGFEDIDYLNRVEHIRTTGNLFHLDHKPASKKFRNKNRALLRKRNNEKKS